MALWAPGKVVGHRAAIIEGAVILCVIVKPIVETDFRPGDPDPHVFPLMDVDFPLANILPGLGCDVLAEAQVP